MQRISRATNVNVPITRSIIRLRLRDDNILLAAIDLAALTRRLPMHHTDSAILLLRMLVMVLVAMVVHRGRLL